MDKFLRPQRRYRLVTSGILESDLFMIHSSPTLKIDNRILRKTEYIIYIKRKIKFLRQNIIYTITFGWLTIT